MESKEVKDAVKGEDTFIYTEGQKKKNYIGNEIDLSKNVINAAENKAGEYLANKAPYYVTPGVQTIEGVYVNDLAQIQPWIAYYDRIIARTDFNAGNAKEGIPDIHYHTYEWGSGKSSGKTANHVEGEYIP